VTEAEAPSLRSLRAAAASTLGAARGDSLGAGDSLLTGFVGTALACLAGASSVVVGRCPTQ
jgi:hypothetical protein